MTALLLLLLFASFSVFALDEAQVPSDSDWTNHGVVLQQSSTAAWDRHFGSDSPGCIVKKDGTYYMYYIGASGARTTDGGPANRKLGVATSTDGYSFTKYSGNPVLTYQPHNNQEEGVTGVDCILDTSGTIQIYYGGLLASNSTSESVDVKMRRASSTNGTTITDHGQLENQPTTNDSENWPYFTLYAPDVTTNPAGLYHIWHGKERPANFISGTSVSSFGNTLSSNIPGDGNIYGGGDLARLSDNKVVVFLGVPTVRAYTADISNLRSWTTVANYTSVTGGARGTAVYLDRDADEWRLYVRQGENNNMSDTDQVHLYTAPARLFDGAYYVAPGSTSGSGTVSSPWRVSQAAACSVCEPGDIIYFRGGTYNSGFWYTGPNGTAGNPITFRNYPGEIPIFDGENISSRIWGSGSSVEHLVFQGLMSKNMYYSGFAVGSYSTYASDNIVWRYNIADRNSDCGFTTGRNAAFGGPASNITMEYNIASRNGLVDTQDRGGWCAGVNQNPHHGTAVIRGNVAFHNINGNLNKNSDGGGIMLDDGGTDHDLTAQHIVENNLSFENGGTCISNNYFDNNITRDNTCYGNMLDTRQSALAEVAYSLGANDGNVLKNNLLVPTRDGTLPYGTFTGSLTNFTQAGNYLHPTVHANPNVFAGDFHPLSAAAGVATSTGQVATDIGFDPLCLKESTTAQPVSWWHLEPDLDYILSVGGIEGCFNPQERDTTSTPGAYNSAGVDCDLITEGDALPYSGLQSPPWYPFDEVGSKRQTVGVTCFEETGEVTFTAGIEGEDDIIVYKHGYVRAGGDNAWRAIVFEGTPHAESLDGVWLQGRASLPNYAVTAEGQTGSANFVVAYVCKYAGGVAECGCRDDKTGCTNVGKWSVQKFMIE